MADARTRARPTGLAWFRALDVGMPNILPHTRPTDLSDPIDLPDLPDPIDLTDLPDPPDLTDLRPVSFIPPFVPVPQICASPGVASALESAPMTRQKFLLL